MDDYKYLPVQTTIERYKYGDRRAQQDESVTFSHDDFCLFFLKISFT